MDYRAPLTTKGLVLGSNREEQEREIQHTHPPPSYTTVK